MDHSLDTLADLQKRAVDALSRYLALPSGEGTEDLRTVAGAFVSAREHFFTREGLPDWLGRTYVYRTWVREVMSAAHVPGETMSSLQAAIRYHTGNILRDRLDAETLEDLGLQSASPRARSVEKRERYSETLSIFSGGAELADTQEILSALRMMEGALRRVSIPAVRKLKAADRKAIREEALALFTRAEEVAVAAGYRRKSTGE